MAHGYNPNRGKDGKFATGPVAAPSATLVKESSFATQIGGNEGAQDSNIESLYERFAEETVSTNNSTPFIPNEVQGFVDDTLEYGDDIEFANHAGVGDEWLTLSDLSEQHDDAEIFRNNCDAVSYAIAEDSTTEDNIRIVRLDFQEGCHVATYMTANEEDYVIDWTYRQYDIEAPFPYIAPKEQWLESVQQHVHNQYGDSLVEQTW